MFTAHYKLVCYWCKVISLSFYSKLSVEACNVTRYTCGMIKSFRHKGLKKFFETGSKAGIQTEHAGKLTRQLGLLNRASQPEDVNIPGWYLHSLHGDLAGLWSIKVNGNWRLTFRFENGDAILVDYQDYH